MIIDRLRRQVLTLPPSDFRTAVLADLEALEGELPREPLSRLTSVAP